MKFSKVTLFLLISLLLLIGCGGNTQSRIQMPIDGQSGPRATPTPVSTPITITAASVFSSVNVGQTWDFTNGYGDICSMAIEYPKALNTEPDNSILNIEWTDTSQVAGRPAIGTVVIHFNPGGIKSNDRCYWMLNVHGAELFFPIFFENNGSGRSTSSVIYLRNGCPWCGPNGQPSTEPYINSWQVIDTQPGMPVPYLISPPTVSTGDHFVNETRVCATGGPGLTYDAVTPTPTLCGQTDGEYWRTDFYITNVSTPIYTGPAIVSDQFEGICGHELWYFAPGFGIVKIESPYDGGEIKHDQRCIDWLTHDPKLTIVRTH